MIRRLLNSTACYGGALLCLLFATTATRAAPGTAAEYEVKAAYVVNFPMFVTPAEGTATSAPPDTIDVAIVGNDPFGKSFAPVEGRVVDKAGRKLRIHRFRRLDAAAVGRCRTVFIARSESSRLDHILKALRGRSVLTVSDIDRFVERGGMIGLVIRRDRVRWTVNRRTLDEAGLTPSAQLLRNAVQVVGRPRDDGGKEEP